MTRPRDPPLARRDLSHDLKDRPVTTSLILFRQRFFFPLLRFHPTAAPHCVQGPLRKPYSLAHALAAELSLAFVSFFV